LKGRWPALSVIFVTAHGSIREAVQATQHGAFSFLVKPVEKSELLGQVRRAIAESPFALADGDWRAAIVSRGKLMEERLGQANWAAGSGEPVLLTGENGTGKELFARAIHAASARRGEAFIKVNCRGSAEQMLETELFGNANDAVNAAESEESGAIRAARGGTLLLEEIGDLSARLQVKLRDLLSVESADEGRHQTHTNVRLICTTSCDLKQLMEAGRFREDLYYRINILPIEIPPLGRRREDIPLLVSHFLEQATEPGGEQKIYSPEAIELLATADWPGNVRQLFDLVKQNVALSRGAVMTKAFVQQSLGTDATRSATLDEARNKFAHDYLARMLQATSGNVTKSARLAKRNRSDFYRLLERYRVRAENIKSDDASTEGDDEE
jgi:two-component system response regulator GlrR